MIELPPLFDDITDKELSEMSSDIATYVAGINKLREKQLHGGGISNDEVKEGIKLILEVRKMRAGKASTAESRIPLEKMF